MGLKHLNVHVLGLYCLICPKSVSAHTGKVMGKRKWDFWPDQRSCGQIAGLNQDSQ